jgi:hypothetical protein
MLKKNVLPHGTLKIGPSLPLKRMKSKKKIKVFYRDNFVLPLMQGRRFKLNHFPNPNMNPKKGGN